jgi:hypothetical protein
MACDSAEKGVAFSAPQTKTPGLTEGFLDYMEREKGFELDRGGLT